MKTLILAVLLLLPFSASAQSITNIVLKFTVNGATNATLTIDAGTKKDAARIAGLVFAYGSYAVAQGTNTVSSFDTWLKRNYLDFIESYAEQKQAADNAVTLAKLTSLLTVNSDLLTASDLNSLAAIAAKAP